MINNITNDYEYPVPHDMVLKVSCAMSDPSVKVFLEAKEIRAGKNIKKFSSIAGQQMINFNAAKLDYPFAAFNLLCKVDPAFTTSDPPPQPFNKGLFVLSFSKSNDQ